MTHLEIFKYLRLMYRVQEGKDPYAAYRKSNGWKWYLNLAVRLILTGLWGYLGWYIASQNSFDLSYVFWASLIGGVVLTHVFLINWFWDHNPKPPEYFSQKFPHVVASVLETLKKKNIKDTYANRLNALNKLYKEKGHAWMMAREKKLSGGNASQQNHVEEVPLENQFFGMVSGNVRTFGLLDKLSNDPRVMFLLFVIVVITWFADKWLPGLTKLIPWILLAIALGLLTRTAIKKAKAKKKLRGLIVKVAVGAIATISLGVVVFNQLGFSVDSIPNLSTNMSLIGLFTGNGGENKDSQEEVTPQSTATPTNTPEPEPMEFTDPPAYSVEVQQAVGAEGMAEIYSMLGIVNLTTGTLNQALEKLALEGNDLLNAKDLYLGANGVQAYYTGCKAWRTVGIQNNEGKFISAFNQRVDIFLKSGALTQTDADKLLEAATKLETACTLHDQITSGLVQLQTLAEALGPEPDFEKLDKEQVETILTGMTTDVVEYGKLIAEWKMLMGEDDSVQLWSLTGPDGKDFVEFVREAMKPETRTVEQTAVPPPTSEDTYDLLATSTPTPSPTPTLAVTAEPTHPPTITPTPIPQIPCQPGNFVVGVPYKVTENGGVYQSLPSILGYFVVGNGTGRTAHIKYDVACSGWAMVINAAFEGDYGFPVALIVSNIPLTQGEYDIVMVADNLSPNWGWKWNFVGGNTFLHEVYPPTPTPVPQQPVGCPSAPAGYSQGSLASWQYLISSGTNGTAKWINCNNGTGLIWWDTSPGSGSNAKWWAITTYPPTGLVAENTPFWVSEGTTVGSKCWTETASASCVVIILR